jgi:2-oxoglutarate-Fe(II)-dependent oxygenase superfamily protein
MRRREAAPIDPDRLRDPGLQRALLHQIEQRLAACPSDARLLRFAGELARTAGDLAVAARHFASLAEFARDDEHASVLARLLSGDPAPAAGLRSTRRPVPFVRVEKLLPPATLEAIWTELERLQAGLIPNWIGVDDTKKIDPDLRHSSRVADSGGIAPLILPHIVEAIERSRALSLLGLDRLRLGSPDLSVTVHGHGGVFRPHCDIGSGGPRRRLTYIYYIHKVPRRFSGGDLLLFDDDGDGGTFHDFAYTRIAPTHNSLILFPSDRVHGVTEVDCPDPDLMAARWTINGWLHEEVG